MTNSLRDKIRSFQYNEEFNHKTPATIVKDQKIQKPIKAKSQKKLLQALPRDKYTDLKDLPPSIPNDGMIIFVGFNPGTKSSLDQHHYAHATNLFWKLLNALCLLDTVMEKRGVKDIQDDFLKGILRNCDSNNNRESEKLLRFTRFEAKPCHDYALAKYGIGFTDLCLRCTKQANELNMAEKMANVPRLFTEFALSRAPYVVVVGKGIWEVIVKFIDSKYQLKTGFRWGKQNDDHIVRAVHAACGYKPSIYVFPNTSGLVALMKYPEKLELWNQLVTDMLTEGSQ